VILSAGLSPAWQQVLVFDHFRPGEVNRARRAIWHTAGKVTNVGNAAHHLGGPSLTLTIAGGQPLAEMDRELEELGVPRRWIVTQSATRVCTTIIDLAAGAATELVEESRPISTEELDRFRTAYAEEAARADVAVITGSLPVGTPVSIYRDLVERTPCPIVLDFRGEGLLSVVDMTPNKEKPNREELARTVGRPLATDAALREAMQLLNRRGAAWVVITQGGGPVWLSSDRDAYRLHPPTVDKVVNPIGSGDAMAAAIAWATSHGRDIVDAVKLGIAAASENLRELLPCRLDHVRVRQRATEVRVEQL